MGTETVHNDAQNVRDSSFHVSDCRIWAEIQYLDSPTDYRECLSTRTPRVERVASVRTVQSNSFKRGAPGRVSVVLDYVSGLLLVSGVIGLIFMWIMGWDF